MGRYRHLLHIVVFMIIVGLTLDMEKNPFTPLESPVIMETVKTTDPLYAEIKQKAKKYEEPAQNAYIDKVWKKTPGRNGLKVNVEKSYAKMKQEDGTFTESKLVFDQTAPEIDLKDLPAAPIYRGHPEKKMVALLINVSWGEEYIPEMLSILRDNRVKASFFIEGKWAKNNAELVKMIAEQGHLIGNHAYNHPDMARLSNQSMVDQIVQTNDILKAITGSTPKWFAPPSGSYNNHVVEVSHHLNMETVLWTVDTIDWKNPSVSVMLNRVNNQLHPGATILMHPTAATERGLEQLISSIKEKKYKLNTIEKLMEPKR
ncbi:polysaccharide deacetylase family protein [Virgibacillus pantothenticus]|uniref:polysaccharide deacetylase family protein n=1 Tax=Virgibacillus pantothenticus TaxID=1473 RepID=UPI0009849A34|nr:polysaccharide deacetylase family protein [Virgibacillus pantothenticus]